MSDEEVVKAAREFGEQVARAVVTLAKAQDAYILGILEGFKKEPTKADYALTPGAAPGAYEDESNAPLTCKNCGKPMTEPEGEK